MLAVVSPGVAATIVGVPGNTSTAAVRVRVVDDVFELPSETLSAATYEPTTSAVKAGVAAVPPVNAALLLAGLEVSDHS